MAGTTDAEKRAFEKVNHEQIIRHNVLILLYPFAIVIELLSRP